MDFMSCEIITAHSVTPGCVGPYAYDWFLSKYLQEEIHRSIKVKNNATIANRLSHVEKCGCGVDDEIVRQKGVKEKLDWAALL